MEALHTDLRPVTGPPDPRLPQAIPDRRTEPAQQVPHERAHQAQPNELVFPVVGPPFPWGPEAQPVLEAPNPALRLDRSGPSHQPGTDEPEGRGEGTQTGQRRADEDTDPSEATAGPCPQIREGSNRRPSILRATA